VVVKDKADLDGYEHVVIPPGMTLPDGVPGEKGLVADGALAERLEKLYPSDVKDTVPRLKMDAGTGYAQIVTPRTETFLLPEAEVPAQGNCVRLSGKPGSGVCFAGSLDRRPLAESRRILALYLTDLKNTGTQVEMDDRPADGAGDAKSSGKRATNLTVLVRSPGELPLLVRQGKVEMSFRMKDRSLPRIWALKCDGTRSVPVEAVKTAEGFSFQALAVTNAETFGAFELVWE
jgi:hypothetical protein